MHFSSLLLYVGDKNDISARKPKAVFFPFRDLLRESYELFRYCKCQPMQTLTVLLCPGSLLLFQSK